MPAMCTDSLHVCTVVQVPYLPSSKDQTANVMKLLEGRSGRLADLGSGDGRLVSECTCLREKGICKYAVS